MKSTLLWSLTGLNLLLAAILVTKIVPGNQAMAQNNRRASDYLMLPGNVTGLPYSVVYVIDMPNDQLGAFGYDESQKKLQTMPPIDLRRMLEGGTSDVPAKGGTRK